MRLAACLCALALASALLPTDAKKVFTGRRKSGGNKSNNPRRSGTSQKTGPAAAPPPASGSRADSSSHFLAAERGAGSPGSANVHNRELGLFQRKPAASAPEQPKQAAPQANGPIGFEKVNSEAQRKPGPPAYPGAAPNGPPPAYNPHGAPAGGHGGHEAPPAYPGRPVNAPPAYPGHAGAPAGYQQSGYPHQAAYPAQSYGGQQNFGYPNTGYHSPGGYPNRGFGSHPGGGYGNPHQGYGNSYQGGYGASPYGGSPFGQSNSFGGSSFGYGNSHYGSNNFGFSNSPGMFGGGHSSGFGGGGGLFGGGGGGLFGGGYNGFGQHKRSRFGGLPIPIPIPIPIPMGLFGGWGGGHSRSHRELDAFVRNQAANSSSNSTTNVYILNNSTVAPCTTDQFVYGALNVTVISCTAGNCTAIKAFVTTNASGESTSRSAGLTMCLEANTTFSSFSNNTNPKVSDLHRYWMKMCKELVWSAAGNANENASANASTPAANVTMKVSEVVLNETVIKMDNTTEQIPITTVSPSLEPTAVSPEASLNQTLNSTGSSSEPVDSFCDTFDCSWIEMCLPPVEVVEPCPASGCDSAKMIHNPCVRIKMCKSPTTPVSTFATFNNSITRIDAGGGAMQANDVANLTLISFFPPSAPANCSSDSGDASCKGRPPGALPEVRASEYPPEVSSESSPTTSIPPQVVSESSTVSSETTSLEYSTTPVPS